MDLSSPRHSAAARRWQIAGSINDDGAAGMVPRSDQAGVRTAMINSGPMPVPLLTHPGASPIPATQRSLTTLPTPWGGWFCGASTASNTSHSRYSPRPPAQFSPQGTRPRWHPAWRQSSAGHEGNASIAAGNPDPRSAPVPASKQRARTGSKRRSPVRVNLAPGNRPRTPVTLRGCLIVSSHMRVRPNACRRARAREAKTTRQHAVTKSPRDCHAGPAAGPRAARRGAARPPVASEHRRASASARLARVCTHWRAFARCACACAPQPAP